MTAGLTISADAIVTAAGVLHHAVITVQNGKLVLPAHSKPTDVGIPPASPAASSEVPLAIPHLPRPEDAAIRIPHSALALPGFIDLHWHGFGGHALIDGEAAVRQACRLVARSGVTMVYAGMGFGASLAEIARTLEGVAAVVGTATGGARLAGIFLEGPWISHAKRGAWQPENLLLPRVEDLRTLQAAAGGHLRRINVAPELPGALEFIRAARELGIVVSIGHSDCSYEQALAAVEAGATLVNHTFNAMSGLGQRAPGLVGAALTDERLLAELILDGAHVHPAAARALWRARGAAGIALITDGIDLTGEPDGVYDDGGRVRAVADGFCRLSDGTIAGSVSPMDRDVRNAALWLLNTTAGSTPIPTGAALRSTVLSDEALMQLAAISSGNAARAMGLNTTGALAADRDTSIVLLDEQLTVVATVVAGEVVYQRGNREAGDEPFAPA